MLLAPAGSRIASEATSTRTTEVCPCAGWTVPTLTSKETDKCRSNVRNRKISSSFRFEQSAFSHRIKEVLSDLSCTRAGGELEDKIEHRSEIDPRVAVESLLDGLSPRRLYTPPEWFGPVEQSEFQAVALLEPVLEHAEDILATVEAHFSHNSGCGCSSVRDLLVDRIQPLCDESCELSAAIERLRKARRAP